jgi:glutamate/tyrosine decarboxylase-like PLP-dependent enzyme
MSSSSIAVAGGLAMLLLLRQRKRRTEPIEFDHELFSTSAAVDHPTLDNLQGASWKECQASFLDLSTEFIELLPDRPVSLASTSLEGGQLNLPENGLPFHTLLDEVRENIMPKLSAQRGPRYLAYITGGSTPTATMADWLVSVFDQNVKKDGCSVASQVERQTLQWLTELFMLPSEFRGIVTTGATAANLLGILAGRQYVGEEQGVNVTLDGVGAIKVKVFSSSAHESTIKSLGFAGIGQRNLHRVGTTGKIDERMDTTALAHALEQAGPSCGKIVVASAGTVTGTAFDDLVTIRTICDQHGAWLHVDGAFGIYERLLTGVNGRTKGIELADSITLDCHKWLNVPYDAGVCLVRERQYLERACFVDSPYFRSSGTDVDFISLGIENSRRFRAFPVWLSLLAYGRSGITAWVEKDVRLARTLASWCDESTQFELVFYGGLNVVLFRRTPALLAADGSRHLPGSAVGAGQSSRGSISADEADTQTLSLLEVLNDRGVAYMTAPMWRDGRRAIRAAFSNYSTTTSDLQLVQEELVSIARAQVTGEPLAAPPHQARR